MNSNINSYIAKLEPPCEYRELMAKRLSADIKNGTSFVLDEINEELLQIFGEHWRDRFRGTAFFITKSPGVALDDGRFAGVEGIAICLLFAKHGYAYNDGRCLIYREETVNPSLYSDEEAEMACRVIEDILKDAYPELPESFFIGSEEYESSQEGRRRRTSFNVIAFVLFCVGVLVFGFGSDSGGFLLVVGGIYLVCFVVVLSINYWLEKDLKSDHRTPFSYLALYALLLEAFIGILYLVGCGIHDLIN